MPVSPLCIPPSCSERTVRLLCISTLARGSACDETCPGNHLPWEGWGHPAQAASQLPVQRSGTTPALADGPRLLHASPNEQEHCFSLLPQGGGGSLLCRTTPSPTCPDRPILLLALYQHPTLLQLLHPSCLQGFLCVPSRCCLPRDGIPKPWLPSELGDPLVPQKPGSFSPVPVKSFPWGTEQMPLFATSGHQQNLSTG